MAMCACFSPGSSATLLLGLARSGLPAPNGYIDRWITEQTDRRDRSICELAAGLPAPDGYIDRWITEQTDRRDRLPGWLADGNFKDQQKKRTLSLQTIPSVRMHTRYGGKCGKLQRRRLHCGCRNLSKAMNVLTRCGHSLEIATVERASVTACNKQVFTSV